MPRIHIDVVHCSYESISIGTDCMEHLPCRWELYITLQDGNAMPLTRCKWFACKPTRKQVKAHLRAIYAYWLLSCMYDDRLIAGKVL